MANGFVQKQLLTAPMSAPGATDPILTRTLGAQYTNMAYVVEGDGAASFTGTVQLSYDGVTWFNTSGTFDDADYGPKEVATAGALMMRLNFTALTSGQVLSVVVVAYSY